MSAAPQKYVIYYRVSTKRQGKSGLGLEAQKRDVELYLSNYSDEPFEVLEAFTDMESGKHDDPRRRPGLQSALTRCRADKAILLVSKLDRLSRRVSHIAALMDDKGLVFKVATLPNADNFQLHIYAALAEKEREFISLRTKQALAIARSHGRKLGGLRTNTAARNEVCKVIADTNANRVASLIVPMRAAGNTLQFIADSLNGADIATPRGKKWAAMSVRNALERLNQMEEV
ncbi:Site-specific DNA recombinase [Roseovarius tolerans]|uniref:Site-specific DNA recombinase n=1 Tax=Roseovarius tolerans TaxID=74031 RepID=A0A1H8I0G7_9RHOB|nr:recombinase family protein [Roseovarius tolerans]SEN62009.1 Site-specific DNA recombinase [Roseovarius tolerans]